MRSESEIKKLILDIATQDDRIRAVLLSGSRTNPNVEPDKLQDFDISFIVRDLMSFISDHSWIDIFGERIICQMPEEMCIGEQATVGFGYLMLFKDENRIDLSLFPIENFKKDFSMDSLTIVWLDKDHLLKKTGQASDENYHVRKPREQEFQDTCNEFWWVSTYVAKGLLRNEITYAKQMLETVVRPMFMRIIEWKIGSENDFSVSFGKGGRFMKRYLTKSDYEKVLASYSDYGIKNNWQSLFAMTELFGRFAREFSTKMNLRYKIAEQENVVSYLKKMYDEQNYS